MPARIPGFRVACLVVGIVEILLASSILLRGVATSLAPFGIPPVVLTAPHYQDAIVWVYAHMMVIGLLTVALGYLVTEADRQTWTLRLLALINAGYFVLDARTADWPLGNALYRGPGSTIPAIICVIFTLVFAITSARAPTSAR